MHKQILFLTFFLSFFSISQQKSESRLQLGVGFNLNRTILENINIDNDPGVVIHSLRKPIGYSLGILRLKYRLTSKIDIISGIDFLSIQKIKYYFYGTTYTSSFGPYEIPLAIQYNFNNSFFITAGIEETIMFQSIRKSTYQKDDYRPKRIVTKEYFPGFYTIAKLSFGYTIHTKSNRNFEIYGSFSKGFKPILSVTLERFDPYNKTTFDYQGTKVEFGMNWYFNKRKKKNEIN